MSVKPRTIDNLGVDASVRYAKDKELFEARFIEESRVVSPKTEVPVVKPYVPSDFDQLFSSGKMVAWAAFSAPPQSSTPRSLFSYQLIPSLGTYETKGENEEKILQVEEALQHHKRSKQGWSESDEEREREEKEKRMIIALFGCIERLDKSLSLINSRRNQFHRG